MNSQVFDIGHGYFLGSLDGLTPEQFVEPGVCGEWSAKDLLAHIASFEVFLGEQLQSIIDGQPTQYMQSFQNLDDEFNRAQVGNREQHSVDELMQELATAHTRALELLPQITPEQLHQPGLLSWYAPFFSLEDLLVLGYYGHKREHGTQVLKFREQLAN